MLNESEDMVVGRRPTGNNTKMMMMTTWTSGCVSLVGRLVEQIALLANDLIQFGEVCVVVVEAEGWKFSQCTAATDQPQHCIRSLAHRVDGRTDCFWEWMDNSKDSWFRSVRRRRNGSSTSSSFVTWQLLLGPDSLRTVVVVINKLVIMRSRRGGSCRV